MIPTTLISTDFTLVDNIESAMTYHLTNDKIQGFVDGLTALRQSIWKVLNTEKYEYPIYSFGYGIELENLIGKDTTYVEIELKRRIEECLLQDDRIKSVENFAFSNNGEELKCTFDVVSVYGEIPMVKEVAI